MNSILWAECPLRYVLNEALRYCFQSLQQLLPYNDTSWLEDLAKLPINITKINQGSLFRYSCVPPTATWKRRDFCANTSRLRLLSPPETVTPARGTKLIISSF